MVRDLKTAPLLLLLICVTYVMTNDAPCPIIKETLWTGGNLLGEQLVTKFDDCANICAAKNISCRFWTMYDGAATNASLRLSCFTYTGVSGTNINIHATSGCASSECGKHNNVCQARSLVDNVQGDCLESSLGKEYRGNKSTTESGLQCMKWTSQDPHNHDRTPENYPNTGLGDHNYCRNPDDGSGGVWCYTTDPDVRYEYCGIPSCSDQGVTCGATNTTETVTIKQGESSTFRTQAGAQYGGPVICRVKYEKDKSCPEMRFSCSSFDLTNKKADCKRGDVMTVKTKGTKTKKFCHSSAPDVTSKKGPIKVTFKSNKKDHGDGAVCTAECV